MTEKSERSRREKYRKDLGDVEDRIVGGVWSNPW